MDASPSDPNRDHNHDAAAATWEDRTEVSLTASAPPTTVSLAPEADQTYGDPDHWLAPGTLIGGRYQVIEQIGRGGMGVVYKVEQIFLNELFALKILTAIDPASFTRFRREAKVSLNLDHKNLVAVTELGVLDNGLPFLVMRFVEGTPLSQEIKVQGQIPWRQALDIFIEICDGLAFAHCQGIVHRDLKPSNFMVGKIASLAPGSDDCRDDAQALQIKIIDFGIATLVDNEGSGFQSVTRTGDVLGSPQFMSPEQCSGKRLDHRSDIYSFGCALFQTLTGVPPFCADNSLATMIMHQTETPPTLKQVKPGLDFPGDLERVMARLLAKEPIDRYQSIEAVKQDLCTIQQGKAVNIASPKRTRIKWLVALWFLSSLVVLTGALMVSKFSTPQQMMIAKPDMMVTTLDIKQPRQTIDAPEAHFARLTMAEAKKQGGPWIFRFPSEPIGQIGTNSRDLQLAQGTVSIPEAKPLIFLASPTISDQPKLFLRFRPDEIWRLEFNLLMFGPEVKDDVAYCISKLTGVRDLKIPDSAMTDKGLAELNNLSLNSFQINQSQHITAKALSSAKWLRQLHTLRASGLSGDFTPVINVLADSPKIEFLDLRNDRITDADLAKLSNCPRLNTIHLAGNTNITDKGLSCLSRLKRLNVLNIRYCSVTPTGVISLGRHKELKELYVFDKSWSEQQYQSLREAMPNCNVTTELRVNQ